jgi:hypothetical protein
MTRPTLVLLLALVPAAAAVRATPLAAQATAVLPDKPLDAPHAKAKTTLVALRDSLLAINSGLARLQRDYQQASPITLEARARVIQQACTGAGRTIPDARSAAGALSASSPSLRKVQADLVRGMERLQTALTGCDRQWGAMGQSGKGEEVRGYGQRRSQPLAEALREFDTQFQRFARGFGLNIRPLGAPKSTLAG